MDGPRVARIRQLPPEASKFPGGGRRRQAMGDIVSLWGPGTLDSMVDLGED